MCPLQYYQIMRNCKDKRQYRYQLVQEALKSGIKPTARKYNTTPKVVRKWVKRFKEGNYQGLSDRSRRPHYCPGETPEYLKDHLVALRKEYKRLGAEQIKVNEDLEISPKTMRKIWREKGVSSRKRRKKYITKRNLREVKKKFKLFEFNQEDTKDLDDIPEYGPYMMKYNLPKVQYTFREVSCGIQFLGFANERSMLHTYLFAKYVSDHLRKYNLLPEKVRRQTDNGVEYCGPWNSTKPSPYTLEIESISGQTHNTIFPRAHRMQADVETVHNLIELEFYEIESFTSRKEFMEKAATYQLLFNFLRPNSYKENKTPWQLAKEKVPNLDRKALMLLPVDLDALMDNCVDFLPQGGYDVCSAPCPR